MKVLRGHGLLVTAGFWFFFLLGAAVILTAPGGIAFVQLFGMPNTADENLVSLFFAGAVGMMLAAAGLERKVSHKLIIVVSWALFTGGFAMQAAHPTWIVIPIGAFCQGMGYGGFSVSFNSQFGLQLPKEEVNRFVAALNAFWALGAVSGPAILAQMGTDITRTLTVLTAAAIVGSPLILLLKTSEVKVERTKKKLPTLVWGSALVMAIYVGAETSVSGSMQKHLIGAYGYQLDRAAWVSSLVWLCFAVSRFAASGAARYVAPRVIIALCALGTLIALYLISRPDTVLLGYGMLGASMGPMFASVLTWGMSAASESVYRATSTIVTTACLSGILTPRIIGGLVSSDPKILPAALSLPWIALFIIGMAQIGHSKRSVRS